ncbi:hypothetical protein [Streptomyces sp. LN325]|uniref:hypothetical protein n=1 Tax=Streptomyces sp. LN325 TaxID=3112976 RepID=UPI0037123401
MRDKAVENTLVSKQMQSFFRSLPAELREQPHRVAEAYGAHLFHRRRRELVNQKRLAGSPFHVGIAVGPADFDRLTQRAVIVSDTLLLSHNGHGARHEIATLSDRREDAPAPDDPSWLRVGRRTREVLHIHCPDLDGLGKWLLDTEPLLRSGLAWYLPSYSMRRDINYMGMGPMGSDEALPTVYSDVPGVLDFLSAGRRAVAQSDTSPIKSQFVIPVIEHLDLPFLEGLSMRDFSKITVEEFDSYRALRSWLRQELLNVDAAMSAIEIERELIKVSHRIQDGIRGVRSQMRQTRRKRAVAVTGAVVGTVSASLIAIYGPALQSALTAIAGGATGGLWSTVEARVSNSSRALRDDPWYFVWRLSRSATIGDA